jgi:hypothetical protein
MIIRANRKKYEWRPVQRKKVLTYIKDIDRNTLLQIDDDETLIKTCSLNTYTQSLCNDYFWELKIQQLLPGFELPIEYYDKGKELYLMISNIDLYFEREEIGNYKSYYYQQFYYDYNADIVYYNLDRRGISVANSSVVNNNLGLLKSMLKLGYHPDQNYINDAYDNYDIIKILVDYINEHSDIDDVDQLLPGNDNILNLPNLDRSDILELLLPFNIVDTQNLLINIALFKDVKSLQIIIDKGTYLTPYLIMLLFIYDTTVFVDNEIYFPITKTLINNKLYPDDETLDALPKNQKSYIKQLMLI